MYRAYLQFTAALLLGFTLCSQQANAITIRYVKADATGANDGTSWSDAYTDLQSALADSALGNFDQIWVAAVPNQPYKPGSSRTSTFLLRSGVEMYGGFDGTESAIEERDIEANVTILSGNIGDEEDPTDNCYHVVTAQGVNQFRTYPKT